MAQIEVTNIDPDKAYTIEEKLKEKIDLPGFDMFGGNAFIRTKVPNYPDLYTVIQNLSPSAAWIWWELIKGCDRRNSIAFYKPVDKVAANRLYKGFRDLKKLDLVKRVKPNYYMINPIAFIPVKAEFNKAQALWKSI